MILASLPDRTFLANIHQRPGLYGLDGSFAQYCVFVDGVDHGTDRLLLDGFREWLVARAGKGGNLVWRALVLHLAFPGGDRPDRDPAESPEANRIAVDTLFGLLDEFLTRRLAEITFQLPATPYPNRIPIGLENILKAAPTDRLKDLYHRYYQPQNATLVFVGDADPALIEKKILARFSDWKGIGGATRPGWATT